MTKKNKNPDSPPQVLSLAELFSLQHVVIPVYQRPYKWTEKNVLQLLKDIQHFSKEKVPYRLGSIIFHKDEQEKLNIVDGQQRLVTLMLLLLLLEERRPDQAADQKADQAADQKADQAADQAADQKADQEAGKSALQATCQHIREHWNFAFSHSISQDNIRQNSNTLRKALIAEGLTPQSLEFLLHSCQVVCFTLRSLSAAFQLFDSQNARGKPLCPHDLLKAFHLREFPKDSDERQQVCIAGWENAGKDALHPLFALYLYRIREWACNESALYFSKHHIDLFKGISHLEQEKKNYPHARILRLALQGAQGKALPFPYQLNQCIFNGAHFFAMVDHYLQKHQKIETLMEKYEKIDSKHPVARILRTLATYPERKRTGDIHVRILFNCLLLCYVDRFGYAAFAKAVEHIFLLAYALRVTKPRVSMETVNNYVLENRLFLRLTQAPAPRHFFEHMPVMANTFCGKSAQIEELFKEWGYEHA